MIYAAQILRRDSLVNRRKQVCNLRMVLGERSPDRHRQKVSGGNSRTWAGSCMRFVRIMSSVRMSFIGSLQDGSCVIHGFWLSKASFIRLNDHAMALELVDLALGIAGSVSRR